MTLARHMYPGETKYFLQKFEEATKQPYRPLIVDLKPTKLENQRLTSDIFESCDKETTINKCVTPIVNHLPTDSGSDHMEKVAEENTVKDNDPADSDFELH